MKKRHGPAVHARERRPPPARADAVATALAHHQAGRLAEAEAGYRTVLDAEANHADALHLLGVVALQRGDPEAAVGLIRRAITVNPDFADFHGNLGHALWQSGRFVEAEASCRRALELREAYPEAHNNLGNALWSQGRSSEAAACYARALLLRPDYVDAMNNLGNALRDLGRHAEAEGYYRQALALAPGYVDAWSNLGVSLRALGRPDDAIACYRRALELAPGFADAWNNMGNALASLDRHDEATGAFRRAIEARPDYAQAHYNLANMLWDAKRYTEAIASYERAVAIKPDYLEAWVNLGNVYMVEKRHEDAVASYRRVLAVDPDHAIVLNNLGNALNERGQTTEAVASFELAVAIDPKFADAWNNMGNALVKLDRLQDAQARYERALELAPGHHEAHNNLGNVLSRLGRAPEAEPHYRRAIELSSEFAEAHANLSAALTLQGKVAEAEASAWRALALSPRLADAYVNLTNALAAQSRLDEAEAASRHAIELMPDLAEAHGVLANTLTALGRIPEAVDHYRHALTLKPDYAELHGNLIFALDFDPRTSAAEAFAERRRWNECHARPLMPAVVRHNNDASLERRLRVGYVSADFREHSAAMVFGPVVLSHDPERVEVVCYSGVSTADHVTARFQDAAALWRSTVGVPDEAMARMIRDDAIDLLVDLSGYSSGHRLKVFAMKAAPVQISAWGHALGTGLDAIDYFFADAVTVPAEAQRYFSEEVVDLPAFVPYSPILPSPDVNPLPALERGGVTFGCFNRLSKVTAEVLALWAEILRAVLGSRVLMKFHGFEHAPVEERIRAVFAGHGVEGARIDFRGGSKSWEHLAAYGEVDLALDPFPHGGGVTALDGLWMGVPMVTLAGERIPSRMGASILTTLGMPEFVASSPAEYVALAIHHAGDRARLAAVRAELRGRLRHSIICDHRAYCRAVEEAYRAMWRRWCGGRQA